MNIYDVLGEMIQVKKDCSLRSMFVECEREKLDVDIDRNIFDVLKNISSLELAVQPDSAEFHPLIILSNGNRSFSIQDMTEEHYSLLSELDLTKLPVNLQARAADVLWLQKHNYNAAIVAHKAYYELFNLWFDENDFTESLDMLRRAICISKQLNDKFAYEKYCQTVYDLIIKIDGEDKKFCSITLIEIYLNYPFGDIDKIIEVLEKSIKINFENPNKTERLYSLKAQCFKRKKNPLLVTQTNLELAEYFFKHAEQIVETDKKGF